MDSKLKVPRRGNKFVECLDPCTTHGGRNPCFPPPATEDERIPMQLVQPY